MQDGYYQQGPYRALGVNAEICSTLFHDSDFLEQVLGGVSAQTIVQSIDTNAPHEERIKSALEAISRIVATTRLGRWIPRHRILHRLEYQNRFYPAYRDHTIHSLHVYLLGWYLFLRCDRIREAVTASLKARATDSGIFPDITIFSEWWAVSSLWHDWGYPFETTKFITDGELRQNILREISNELGRNPFLDALQHAAGRKLSESEMRAVYSAGRYFPWEIHDVDSLIRGELNPAVGILNRMWKRRGAGSPDPTAAIIKLTTQAPQGRDPYYDHGILGALLIGNWWSEIEKFVLKFAERDLEVDRVINSTAREQAAIEIMALEGPVSCAIEAIGFHNIALKDWPEHELARFWGGGDYIPPGLDDNAAHLFFLAICDTLQDWDRQHYVPATDARYRPATASSRMLIQAHSNYIAIRLPDGNEVPAIRKLFHKWLGENDINAIFRHGASFSYPDRVFSGRPDVTVTDASQSELTRTRLERAVVDAVGQAREVLLRDTSTAIGRVGPLIESCIGEIHRLESRMLPRQREEFYQGAAWNQLTMLQSMAASTVTIGTKLPKGDVLYNIGDGGFGVIYVVNAQDGSPMAYKVYHAADLYNRRKRDLFLRGFHAMKKLSMSPYVVDVYDYTELPVGFYMRLVNGKDLQKGLSELPIVHDRLQVLETVARTLVYAHNNEVLHRDVKPANVILDQDENLKPILTDFDLAWISGRSTITSAAYASMMYGAPEQFEERLAPYRSKPTVDVFSFGALVYYVLTEDHPPPMATFTDEHWGIVRGRLTGKLLGQAIDDCVGLIRDCTARAPERRPQSMEVVAARVARIRSTGFDTEKLLSVEAFLSEVALEYADVSDPNDLVNRTGACRWGFEVYHRDRETASIRITVELLRDPSYNNISTEEFRRNVSRRIGDAVSRAKRSDAGGRWVKDVVRRGGLSHRMWMIDVIRVVLTRQNAVRLAHLMSDVTGIIE